MLNYDHMPDFIKKLFFVLIFNSCLFVVLVAGIQNSNNRSKVDLLIDRTISLPIGFITGISFISGSLYGNLITINVYKKK